MKKAWVFVALFCLLLPAACKKDRSGAGKSGREEVQWPEKPASGAPMALAFLSMKGSGKELAARMRAFNFTDKDITGFSGTLHYLDESGEELKHFPWSHKAAGALAAAKKYADIEVGAFIPQGTVKVTAEIRRVDFSDGSQWKAKQ